MSNIEGVIGNRIPLKPADRVPLGMQLLQAERYSEAREQFSIARFYDQANVAAWAGLGIAQFKLGQFHEAIAAFERARLLRPDLTIAIIFESRALIEINEMEYAAKRLSSIEDFSSLPLDELNEYALALIGLSEFKRAEDVLLHGLQSDPGDACLLTNLAQVQERANRIDEAIQSLKKVRQPDAYGQLLMARLQGRRGEIDTALDYLLALSGSLDGTPDGPVQLASQIDFERGQLLDRQGRYEEAYLAFLSGNSKDREHFCRENPQRDIRDEYRFLLDYQQLDAAVMAPQNDEPGARESPILLVGFPRSGTTLLDKILDAHPSLAVVEEKPLFDPIVQYLRQRPEGYPLALASLSEEELPALRRMYWQEVARHIELRPHITVVDKNPLNLIGAQMIRRLFPNARWLFAIRHPYDVVLSCFMQRFKFSEITRGYWDVDQIAEIYRGTISRWLSQRARLKLSCIDIRYEDLIEDREPELRRLFAFFELPWDESVLEHTKSNADRWITSPSYSQATRPIYREALGRWRRYQPWLASAEPSLGSLIKGFGYDLN